ncbi:MAG: cytochrome c biogenesis CcdA family protein [Bacillota bacterium]
MNGVENINFLIAFGAGVISFISPCVLPLIPTYITYLSGVSSKEINDDYRIKKRLFLNSAMFIFGFSLVFTLLGLSATFIGQVLLENQSLLRKIGGVIIIIFGLQMIGLINLSFLQQEKKFDYQPQQITAINSFLLGISFSFGWTPCIGPILSTILIYASSSQTLLVGAGLLVAYSLGLALPFLLVSLFISHLIKYFSKFNQYLDKVRIISGILLIIMGVLVYLDSFQWLSQL